MKKITWQRLMALTAVIVVPIIMFSCSERERSAVDETGARKLLQQRAEDAIMSRAERFSRQDVLVADFYRIYRKLAYPLPVTEIYHPSFHVTGIPKYPWEIWMTWDLEQRINSMGWAAHWRGDERLKELVRRDLEALAGWPEYDVWERPHLAGAHCTRIMAGAWRNWDWIGRDLQEKIEKALDRFVDSYPAWLGDGRLDLTSVEQILTSPQLDSFKHNIPTIAMIARSIAARISGHSLQERIERHTEALILAQLELRREGHTEAVSYDGYILDFVADWLPGASEEVRRRVLDHPSLQHMLDQSWLISAPGNPMNVAPFNDVEAREMPFHASVHAKLLALRENGSSRWFLSECPFEWMRSDALAAVRALPVESAPAPPPSPGALDGLYALSLRTGWQDDDLAAVISATNSSVGHIQKDNGTIVVGTGGKWLIDDPGYQQYMPDLEREFTLGPTAHNYPVINGMTQKTNSMQRLECSTQDGLLYAAVEITGGYNPGKFKLDKVVRHLWMIDDSLVVVADRIMGEGIETVDYSWQINPQAALWLEKGACLIFLEGNRLWIYSPSLEIEGENIKRLPGTRGQITVGAQVTGSADQCIWWLFSAGGSPGRFTLSADGKTLATAGRTLVLK